MTKAEAFMPRSGNQFTLAAFRGDGYDRGRPAWMQIAWYVLRPLIGQWWMPNKLRCSALRLFGARIGAGTLVRHGVRIHWPWKLEIGESSWVGENVWLLNLEPITIGSNTCVSQDVLLCTGSHDRRSASFEFDNAPIAVGDSVWIAARSTVLRGVEIGDGATIGATALVTRDVAPGATVLAPQSVSRESRAQSFAPQSATPESASVQPLSGKNS